MPLHVLNFLSDPLMDNCTARSNFFRCSCFFYAVSQRNFIPDRNNTVWKKSRKCTNCWKSQWRVDFVESSINYDQIKIFWIIWVKSVFQWSCIICHIIWLRIIRLWRIFKRSISENRLFKRGWICINSSVEGEKFVQLKFMQILNCIIELS